MKKNRGEIATILTLGTLVVMAVSSLVANIFLNKPQTVKTRAANECKYPLPGGSFNNYDADSDGNCSRADNYYCVTNPTVNECTNSCTQCENGKCVFVSAIWPFCNNNGCSDAEGGKKCESGQTSTVTSGTKCPIYKDGFQTGQYRDECNDLAKCTIDGRCDNNCCVVNTSKKEGEIEYYCAQQNGQCANGYSWILKSQLAPLPKWCKDPDTLDRTGACNPACCKTNEDCTNSGATGQCSVPNGHCQSGSSCGASNLIKKACAGSSCVWTFCQQNETSNKACIDSTTVSNGVPPKNYQGECSENKQCQDTVKNRTVDPTVKSCVESGKTVSCSTNTVINECCAIGMAKKIHRICGKTNTSGCEYWCEDVKGNPVSCGGPSYLSSKESCAIPDIKAGISCKNPSLPSVSQLGSQQTTTTTTLTGDVAKTCSQYDNRKVTTDYDENDKPIAVSCESVKGIKGEILCKYFDTYQELFCGKCVPNDVKYKREDICKGNIDNKYNLDLKTYSPSGKTLRGKIILMNDLKNINTYEVKIYATNLDSNKTGLITTTNLSTWLWDDSELLPGGKKVQYNIFGIFFQKGTSFRIQSNIVEKVEAGDQNVDLYFGGNPKDEKEKVSFNVSGTIKNESATGIVLLKLNNTKLSMSVNTTPPATIDINDLKNDYTSSFNIKISDVEIPKINLTKEYDCTLKIGDTTKTVKCVPNKIITLTDVWKVVVKDDSIKQCKNHFGSTVSCPGFENGNPYNSKNSDFKYYVYCPESGDQCLESCTKPCAKWGGCQGNDEVVPCWQNQLTGKTENIGGPNDTFEIVIANGISEPIQINKAVITVSGWWGYTGNVEEYQLNKKLKQNEALKFNADKSTCNYVKDRTRFTRHIEIMYKIISKNQDKVFDVVNECDTRNAIRISN